MPPAASIELVDARGHREGALTILERGETVSVFEDAQHRVSMTAQRSTADIAWFSLREDGVVEVEIKKRGVFISFQRGEERLQVEPDHELELLFEPLGKSIRIRSIVILNSREGGHEVMSAARRRRADRQAHPTDELRAWAESGLDRGLEQVHEQLERLRHAGVIDADGKRLVELPADMQPGSRTDV